MKLPRLSRLLPASDQRAGRQSFWLGAITAAQLSTALAQLSLCARILGPEGLGALFIIIAATSLLYGLLTLPGDEVIVTWVTRSLAEGRREQAARILRYALGAALGMRLFAYGVIAMAAPVVSDVLAGGELAAWYRGLFDMTPAAAGGPAPAGGDYVTPTLVYAASGILNALHGENLAVLRLADRLHLGLAAVAAGGLARVAVLAAVLAAGGGLLMVTVASAVGAGVGGAALCLAMMASLRPAGLSGAARSLSVVVPRDVVRFQVSNFGRSAVESLSRHIDVLLIAGLTNVTQLGLYRAAHQMVDAARRPFEALAKGVQGEYSRLWFSSDDAAVRKLLVRFTALALALGALGYGSIAVLHEPVIRIVLGPDFADAARPLLVMIPGGFVFAGVAALYVLPAATGRAMPHLASISAALAAQMVALVALTPTWGATGTALASTIYFLVFAAVMVPFALATLRRRNPAGAGAAS